jgi:hypothetical protein
MDERTVVLSARISRFRAILQGLLGGFAPTASSKKMPRRLTTAATGVDSAYKAATIASSAEHFLAHISAAARHAKRIRHLLQDSVQLGYVAIELAREPILEARGIEAILAKANRTAHRRRGRRAVRPPVTPQRPRPE